MIEEFLKYNISCVNNYLHSYMDELNENIPNKLKEAMEYSLFAGGKRLRPILLLEISNTFGQSMENSIPLACGIEMIHTYSLIHDDLPAMDNDDFRRGKLTNHKVFGEDIAILAGDALLNYGFEIMINHSVNLSGDNQKYYLKAIQEITTASGAAGMITGQVADILNVEDSENIEKLDFINNFKTGQLIKASVLSGAIVQGVSDKVIKELVDYSQKIGLAFQIVDDILDVVGDQKKIGKNLHSDEKNNKKTYVDIYGIQKSKSIVSSLMKEALNHLSECNIKNSNIIELTKFICGRDY
ncbi:polyprenyl synthetase family protein [Alkalibaculum sp. M08DMB]|uniref:Farnesyl diphosphate synthase n=1 Tax=Alkalibaculum sporogenes TaxID=2655001 RepID=A0A6A7K7S5_9FIRM|nr:farnesyl diphosphate synthase [Alkalibaculum sporogenes]MPW25163.1 polyprenyl synthetase family protein [Alkalibaculum sporogenes]